MINNEKRYYFSIFLVSLYALSIQISLTRILSVVIGYQLAFFCISLAMLGMTAGAVFIYLKGRKEEVSYGKIIATNFVYLGLSTVFVIIYLSNLRISHLTINLIPQLIFVSIFTLLPFYFSGIIITILLMKPDTAVGKMYFFDLIGASAGCIVVLFLMNFMSAIEFLLFISFLSILTSFIFIFETSKNFKKIMYGSLVFLIICIGSNYIFENFRLNYIKGVKIKKEQLNYERWNSFSHVSMVKPTKFPGIPGPMWGPVDNLPKSELKEGNLIVFFIDGEAGTGIVEFNEIEDLEYLKYDIVNIGHYISEKNKSCIIGVGSGRDIHSSILYKYKETVAVEINPIFIDIIKGINLNVANIAQNPNIKLEVDDGRSYFATNKNQNCNILMMSLIDTWASTGTGAMTLTENNLYTVEAWETFLKSLSPNGIFTVSRWYDQEYPDETGKIFTLATSSLYSYSKGPVGRNILLLGTGNLSTLLVKKTPFTLDEKEEVKRLSQQLGFKILYSYEDENSYEIFKRIGQTTNYEELQTVINNNILNLEPTRDENPYFFNLINWKSLKELPNLLDRGVGIVTGNLKATFILIILLFILIVLSIILILLPLITHSSERPGIYPVFYFFGIGAGFILFEIGLIQRISLVLGRPEYALGIVLASIILSLGLGSLISNYIKDNSLRKNNILLFGFIIFALILVYSKGIYYFSDYMMNFSILTRILISIGIIFPIGLLLGFGFPIGMRLISIKYQNSNAWLWAINGIAGVSFSVLAVIISMYFGISFTFYLSAIFYISVTLILTKFAN